MKRILGVLGATLIAATSFASCTYSKTDTSSMGCVYNGGPVDSKDFRGYTEPGAGRQSQGAFSKVTEVPVTIRQYRISLSPGSGDVPSPDSVSVKVKGIGMQFEPTISFTLNTEIRDGKPVACTFVEKILRPEMQAVRGYVRATLSGMGPVPRLPDSVLS